MMDTTTAAINGGLERASCLKIKDFRAFRAAGNVGCIVLVMKYQNTDGPTNLRRRACVKLFTLEVLGTSQEISR